jgi:hypothetical protein
MPSKSRIRLNKIHVNLGLGTCHNKKKERETPTQREKDRENMENLRKTSLRCKQRRTLERRRKIP